MRKVRWLALVLALVVVATPVLAGCSKKEDAKAPIKIGVIAPLTGSLQFEGSQQLNGVQMAVAEANKAGGILGGRLITVIAEDGKGEATESVSAAEKLITRDKVSIIQGAHMTTATKAVMPILEKYGVAMVEAIASVPDLTEGNLPGQKFLYRVNPHAGMEVSSMSKYLADNLKIKKLALLVRNDDWGRTNVTLYTAAMAKLGSSVVATEYYNGGETNFLSQLTSIKNKGADGLFLIGQAQDGGMIIKQAQEVKWDKPIAGAGAFSSDTFVQLAKESANGIFGVVPYASSVDNAANKAFTNAYKAAYPKLPAPDKYAAMPYMAAKAMIKAIELAGSTDPAKVKAALDKVKLDTGVTGPIEFDTQHQAHPDIYITVIENQKVKIISGMKTK